MASIARYERGETAVFTATLRDKDGAAIAAASLTSLSLTLTDAHSGGVVNSRNAQNVLNANNVTVNSSGGLVWTIQIADVAQQGTASVERAEHVAKFVAVTSTETIEHIHRLYITATRGLTTYEDVELQLGEIAENDRLFVEQIIDGITARAEEYTGLRFQYASETQVFSPTTFRDSVRVRRRPVDSVTSLKEDVDGVFGEDLTIAATSGNQALPENAPENLLDPDTSRKWAVSWNDTVADTARVVIDAVDEISPKSLKLKKCNAKSGRVRLYGADDAALTTNVIYYDFDLYDAGDSGAHVFYPQASGEQNSNVGVRWASARLLDGFSFATASLYTVQTGLVTPSGTTRTNTYEGGLDDSNTVGELGRYIGSAYYRGMIPKRPCDFFVADVASYYGEEVSNAIVWGNSAEMGAEEQEQDMGVRVELGTRASLQIDPVMSTGWTQVGSTDVWSKTVTSLYNGDAIGFWVGNTKLSNSTSYGSTPSANQHGVVDNSNGTFTHYLNLGGANPNTTLTGVYPDWNGGRAKPMYWYAEPTNVVLQTSGPFDYITCDPRSFGNGQIRRGAGVAVSDGSTTATIGIRLDPTSAGDYWGFVQWSYTNGNGFYYLRDRQVLRWQTKKSTYTNPYVDIAIAESALADSEWHILTVCEDEDGKVTAILDGATVGTATFSTVANMDGLVVYAAGGVPIPKQYMKLDGSTPYWPESGGTYASNGAAKMDLAYLSLGDENYAHDDGAATTLAFAQLANAEGMHHLGLSTDTLKRRYWAIDFDGVTKLGAKSQLEIGAVELGSRHESQYDPTDYYVDADAGTVNLRAGTFLGGHGSVQVVYAGGYRDIGAVPMSLRLAATQQAAYIYQRRSSMGLKSESISGMSQTRWSEDLLPAFKDALDRLVPPVVF